MIFEPEIFGDFIVRFVGEENAEIFVQNEYTQYLLLDIVNIVIVVWSARYKALGKSILDYELFGKIANKYCRFHCSKFPPQNMYREKPSHRAYMCRLVYTIIVLVVNAMRGWKC